MNPDTGKIYRGEQAIRDAEARGEVLEDLTPGWQEVERRTRQQSETRDFLNQTRRQSIHRKRAKR
jgi:hypothetical protein